ncbi:MAG TPA: fibronectin type III domain-containing protein, partial [Candidatus Dormibacteraeota bacterium]|nr:fibronectin type III domain-containing protein [Candidatus Dormibacteraeota bacterium]
MGCGEGSSGGVAGPTPSAILGVLPGAPAALAVTQGDRAVGLAWQAPASAGSSFITSYTINIAPSAPQARITVTGTAAVISGLADGTSYTVTVSATNAVGTGPASVSVQALPTAASTNAYVPITVSGDPNAPSGNFDPAILNASTGTTWLAYSSVNYYHNSANQLVQDVSTSLAKSTGPGAFSYLQTLGVAQGPVTVTDTTHSVCGQATCTGRWVYEVPFLIEDGGDPNPSRVYKLFAFKYFLYPPATPATEYGLGAIVMWTAGSPNGVWSPESTVLRWNLTPPEISGGTNINTLNPALSSCLLLTEGAASIYGKNIDFVFGCPYISGGTTLANIVMLRSIDHAQTFSFVSTLLTAADASIAAGATVFSAPALLPMASGAPALLVTPVVGNNYAGCLVLPFASEQDGTLMRDSNDLPISILSLPSFSGDFGGACAWDQGESATGILIDDLDPSLASRFRIVATNRSL